MSSPGPGGLTTELASRTQSPSDLRSGTVVGVSARGIDVSVGGTVVPGAAHLPGYNPAVGDPVAMLKYDDVWLVLGRPVGPGTPTDNTGAGGAVGPSVLDAMALSGGGSTLATSSGSTVIVPRYGVGFFHPTNHWVLLLVGVSWYSSVANDMVKLQVLNAVTGAVVGETELIMAGTVFFGRFEVWAAMVPPAQGGQGASYYMTILREGGTGASRVDDVAARRGFMVALDMGDTSVVRTT